MLVNLSNLQGDADNSGHLAGTQVQTLPFEHGTQTVTIIWNAMVNQMAGMANAAQAAANVSAPAAVPSILDVSSGVTQLLNTGAGGDDSTFATAAGAWAQGAAVQQSASLQGQLGAPCAGGIIAQLAAMLQAAQAPANTAAADAVALTQTQMELDACQ